MKQCMVLLVLFTVVGISCDPNNPDISAAGENYLPLAPGNTWEYDVHVVSEGHDTTMPATVTMSTPFTFDSITWFGVNDFCEDKATSSPLPVFCAAWGTRGNQVLFIRQGPGPVRFGYEVLIDFPLWIGKSWLTRPSLDTTYVTTSGDTIVMQRTSRRTYRGRSTVVVPAGSFVSCIEIADTSSDLFVAHPAGGGPETISYSMLRTREWYAKDVGMVKQIIELIPAPGSAPLSVETRTLTKFTLTGL